LDIKESVYKKLKVASAKRDLTTDTLMRQILEVWLIEHKEDR